MRSRRTLAAATGVALLLVALLLGAGEYAATAQSPDAVDIPEGYLPVTVYPAIARDNMILFWDNIALDAIRAEPPGPPMVARILAMVHTAQYEAWAQYDATATGTLLGDRFHRPPAERTVENKSIATSYRHLGRGIRAATPPTLRPPALDCIPGALSGWDTPGLRRQRQDLLCERHDQSPNHTGMVKSGPGDYVLGLSSSGQIAGERSHRFQRPPLEFGKWRAGSGQPIARRRIPDPYEGMHIRGVGGINEAQRASLLALGAVEG